VAAPVATGLPLRERPWSRAACVVAHGACLAALTSIAFSLDQWCGASSSWKFCAFFLVPGAALSVRTVYRLRSGPSKFATFAFVAAMTTMHFVDLNPVKPYRRFFDAVHVGMTRPDVLAALHVAFPDGGRFRVPTIGADEPDRMHFNLDLRDGRYDAECVEITLVEGKVVAKDYSPD
jgi:hypothetical protein